MNHPKYAGTKRTEFPKELICAEHVPGSDPIIPVGDIPGFIAIYPAYFVEDVDRWTTLCKEKASGAWCLVWSVKDLQEAKARDEQRKEKKSGKK